jgi:hypothetical protein
MNDAAGEILWRGFDRCRALPEDIESAYGASSSAFCFPHLTCDKKSYQRRVRSTA